MIYCTYFEGELTSIQNSPFERVRFLFEICFRSLSRREEILEDNGEQTLPPRPRDKQI